MKTQVDSIRLTMDTVPAYDFEKAFEPWEDEAYVYGRGTVDMKGPLPASTGNRIPAELAQRTHPVLSCCPVWTDAGFIQAGTDSQCIILGPGDIATAHSVHEKISKKQIFTAAEIYKTMAMEICRVVG